MADVGLIVYLLVIMVGMLSSGWMLHRIHGLRAKANSYSEMTRQLYGVSDRFRLSTAKALMAVVPIMQWIIHLSFHQVRLDTLPLVKAKAGLSIGLIALTLIPYSLSVISWWSAVGWICLAIAGALSWTPNSFNMLPSQFSAAMGSSIIIHMIAICMMGSFMTVVEYLGASDEPTLLILNCIIQVMVIAYPMLFGSVEFRPVSYYLCIPISLASMLLFSHFVYQREDENEAPTSPAMRYLLPLAVLVVANGIALIPAVYIPFRTAMNSMAFNLFSVDLLLGLGTLVLLLRKSDEIAKASIILTIFTALFIANLLLSCYTLY